MNERELAVRPIAYVRTNRRFKFDAPSQPELASQERNHIEFLPDDRLRAGLQDLEGFDRIWLISWFDRNTTWRPRVLPPRGPAKRRGVFSTRSPHRPNPIGLTAVTLFGIQDRTLEVGPLDLTDGTPILDVKPYLRTVDAHPESSLGWLESVQALESEPAPYEIELTAQAETELRWLLTHWHVDFTARAFSILARDPSPHRTRRILQLEENRYRIACGAWRMYFHLSESRVIVEEIEKGYSDETLNTPGNEEAIDREAQIAFHAWKHGGNAPT